MACRDWLKTQLAASFKGVPFEASEDGRETGRRNQTHEYASSETWDNEDLGRRKLLIHVTALVDGDDADQRSEALLAACSSPGAGLLQLPGRPQLMAVCEQVSSGWQKNAQGVYQIAMQFVAEAASVTRSVSPTQFAGLVDIAAEQALTAAGDAFSVGFDTVMRRFSPARFVPAVARAAAAETVALSAEAIDTLAQQCRMEVAARAEIAFATRMLRDDAARLAFQGQSPDLVAAESFIASQSSVDNGYGGALLAIARRVAAAADAGDLAHAVPVLTGFVPQRLAGTARVFSVRAEQALTAEVARFVNRAGLYVWARAIGRSRYHDRAAAIAVRAALVQAFADESLPELRGLLDAAVTYLGRVTTQLPSDLTLTVYQSLPAVVIATRLYADPTRAAELVARNAGSDPLYMPTTITAAAA